MKEGKWMAWSLLLALSLIWGSSFILIKKGLVGLSPGEVGALRILAASLFLFPFALAQIKKIRLGEWKYLVSVGLLGSLFPSFLFAIAQTRLSSAVTGILNTLTPLFTLLVAQTAYHHRYGKGVTIGILTGFAGSVVLILAGSGATFQLNAYAFFVVLATFFYALNLNIIKNHLQRLSSLSITSVSLLVAGPLAAVYLVVFTDYSQKIIVTDGMLPASAYIVLLGVLGTAIALILFNRLVQLTDPVFTSSVTYIIPLIAVLWGLLDGEKLYVIHFVGMAAILVGVFIVNRTSRSKSKDQ
ncbi:MAG: DMT family transporter [Cyclobacteriaceae bacterium]|nr:DMT family transporter [Cyclobacteriaceae bacterium]